MSPVLLSIFWGWRGTSLAHAFCGESIDRLSSFALCGTFLNASTIGAPGRRRCARCLASLATAKGLSIHAEVPQ